MIFCDVNIFVNLHRADAPQHRPILQWFERILKSNELFGVSDVVLSGFLRIVTHPKVFIKPSSQKEALAFANEIRSHPHAIQVTPGARHWDIFMDLLEKVGANGNLIPDAYLATLAIEGGHEFLTFDGDYSRFPGLRLSASMASINVSV